MGGLWFTVYAGGDKLPVYIATDFDIPQIFLGEHARRIDEPEEKWDAAGPCRLDELDKDPRLHAISAGECEVDTCVGEAKTYLRAGVLHSICESHAQQGDLLFWFTDANSAMMSPKEITQYRVSRTRALKDKGYSTRMIARELGVSQSAVQYYLQKIQ